MYGRLTTIVLFMCMSWGTYAQDIITFSGEFGTDNKGFELRKEFKTFYVGFYAENIEQEQTMFSYGFNGGFLHDFRSFSLMYGVNIGGIKETALGDAKKHDLLTGVHLELDYKFNESFFIGIKCRYDYNKNNSLIRPMFKIGYKF